MSNQFLSHVTLFAPELEEPLTLISSSGPANEGIPSPALQADDLFARTQSLWLFAGHFLLGSGLSFVNGLGWAEAFPSFKLEYGNFLSAFLTSLESRRNRKKIRCKILFCGFPVTPSLPSTSPRELV